MSNFPMATDAVTSATPLSPEGATAFNYFQLLIGSHGGSLGETSAIALLIGGVYLIALKVITVTTPVAFLGTMAVAALVLGGDPIYHLLTGGALLGAIFMATDYVTSPTTERGKIIFGVGCGLVTIIIRLYGHFPEGVSFAILLMNVLTPHIDRLTPSKPFGGGAQIK
jgi:electron transport complex protein RnfD